MDMFFWENFGKRFGLPISRVQELMIPQLKCFQAKNIFDQLNSLVLNDVEKIFIALVCFYTFPSSEKFSSQEQFLEEYTRLKVFIFSNQCKIPEFYRDDILAEVEGRY